MAKRRIDIDPLFIAVPELAFKVEGLKRLLASGAISRRQYDEFVQMRQAAKKANKSLNMAISGEGVIGRILAVAPEIFTVSTVNVLRTMGVINETQGHAARLAIRSLNAATRGGLPTNKEQIFSRFVRLAGVNISHERIDMWNSMGILVPRTPGMSKEEWRKANTRVAERWKGYLTAGTLVKESLAKARRAKSLMDAMLVLGQTPVSNEMIDGLVRSGMISPRFARQYKAAIALGVKQWKVFEGAKRAEGLRARLLLVGTGSLNDELLDFLARTKVISRQQRRSLRIAAMVSHNINQRLLEDLTQRRYRIKPGEAPIKTFARASRVSDSELLKLLAASARESRREARRIGERGPLRAAQYNLAARGLHVSMRDMWEGVGYLSIWGERDVEEAAVESMATLHRRLLRNMPDGMEQSLIFQAKAGVDSYISRAEHTAELSRRVYKNVDLWRGKVDKRINMSLLQGKSAKEIADDVYKFISPRTPGGSSYAAMRLARTEINNAFHFTTIRYNRELPWVKGMKWNLSGSHPTTDICNEHAEVDHDNLGAGVYRKSNVPPKPHPNCFCYMTTVLMDENEFINAQRRGRFDRYVGQVAKGRAFDEEGLGSAGMSVLARAIGTNVADPAFDTAAKAIAKQIGAQ